MPVFAVVGKVGLVATAFVLGAVDGEAVGDPVEAGVAAGNEACAKSEHRPRRSGAVGPLMPCPLMFYRLRRPSNPKSKSKSDRKSVV